MEILVSCLISIAASVIANYICKWLYSEDLDSGEDYSALSQTICVNIINFNLFDCENYHSHFMLKEKERDEIMTDKLAIHFFELKKVGKYKRNTRESPFSGCAIMHIMSFVVNFK